MRNRTSVTEFILLGLTDNPELQAVIFFFLLLTYVLSVTGNLTIIVLTLLHSHLKTPMYFFLRNFSFLEISFTSVCNPRFLVSILTGDKSISYNACAAQLFFFILLGSTEFFLLASMSYDRYVAICKPLHYPTIMSHKVCYQLVGSSWLAGFLVIFPPLTMGLQLDFCDTNVIDHFTCDSAPLLHRHKHSRAHELCSGCADSHVHLDAGHPLLLLHPQDDAENPLSPTEKKGLFNLLLPHDCCLHLLWKLHLHVRENLSKGGGCFDKGGGHAQHLCGSYAESIYLHLKEPAGETGI